MSTEFCSDDRATERAIDMVELHTLQNTSSLDPRDPNKVRISLVYRREINSIIGDYVRLSIAEGRKLDASIFETFIEDVKAEDREALLIQLKDIAFWLNDINCVAYGIRPEQIAPFIDLPISDETPAP